MRFLQASLALLVAASACATFTSTDTQVADDGGAPTPDAAPGAHFCATKPLSEDHACFDFDDNALPALSSGWLVVQKGADTLTLLPGGAHGSPFSLELSGGRPVGGASTGAGIRRVVGGARPLQLTAALSAKRSSVNGSTSDGSQNYDLLVVKGSSATQAESLQIELRPDGKLNLLDVVIETADGGGVSYARQLALLDLPTLAQELTDVALTISIANGTSTATLQIAGAQVGGGTTQFQTMTRIDEVTWGDGSVSQGVDYRVLIDDLTLDVTR